MLKKILGIALVLAVAFFAVILPLSAIKSKRVIAGADGTTPDENYWFESIQTGIAVNRDKTFSVTERMKVGFSKAETNTGIIRDIQRVSQTARIVDGKRKKGQPYLANLSDVKATIDGADAKITQSYYDAGQFFSVKMQKEDESFFGATDVENDTGFHDFKLSYLYDMSDDKIGGFDDFTFDVLGYETALTKRFSVTVAFPSEIDASQVSVRTNEMEAWSPAEGEGWRVEGNTLTMNARLNEKDRGYTVQVLFPDGYFQTELTHFWYYWLFAVPALGFIIAGLIIVVKYFPRKAVEPVEVVPPKGISLMRASALRYGEARLKDVPALILEWAAKGYVALEQDGKRDIVIRKVKDLPEKEGDKKTEYFNALFSSVESGDSGDTLSTKKLRRSWTQGAATKERRLYYAAQALKKEADSPDPMYKSRSHV